MALLVGIQAADMVEAESRRSLEELGRLATTAGGTIAHQLMVRVREPDPKTFLGSGKVEELKGLAAAMGCDLVLIDRDLSPGQQAALQAAMETRVLDRTALILDIFARRAASREGRLQVELAQLQYLLPRLKGMRENLSRLGGGIGTRGPGESKLEVDRRRITDKVSHLKREIEEVRHQRQLRRQRRHATEFPVASLIGYTNAGKSTMMNRLTGAGVLAEDKLFATLDATTRVLGLPDGSNVGLTDTVGFIHNLPTGLVAAFRATLEEIADSDVLLHLVDASSPGKELEISVTEEILRDISADQVPRIMVWTKADQVSPEERPLVRGLMERVACEAGVLVSALTGEGMDELLRAIADVLQRHHQVLHLRIPIADGQAIAELRAQGGIRSLHFDEEWATAEVALAPRMAARFARFATTELPT